MLEASENLSGQKVNFQILRGKIQSSVSTRVVLLQPKHAQPKVPRIRHAWVCGCLVGCAGVRLIIYLNRN